MAKSFWIIKSLLPGSPNLKPKMQWINYFLQPLIDIKMIHTICSIQIYENQDENLTAKMILRLYSFAWI